MAARFRVVGDDQPSEDTYERPTLPGGPGGGTYDPMEARVAKLEETRIETVAILARIDQRLDGMERHLATKADVAEIKGELRGKLGVWQFLTVMGGAVGLILAWPALSRLLGV